jgi:hypothetical protein
MDWEGFERKQCGGLLLRHSRWPVSGVKIKIWIFPNEKRRVLTVTSRHRLSQKPSNSHDARGAGEKTNLNPKKDTRLL